MDLRKLSIKKAHQSLLAKDFSSEELTRAYLRRIKELNLSLNAFLAVTEEIALMAAKEVDKKIARGEEIKPLAGLPMAMKDNILVAGVRASAGSKILENYKATYDATAVKKLKENNFVHLGRTNLDEFALGSSTENSAFGPTRNPLDPQRVPGGSSGGSAAAVAADMCLYALGSDTGGSVRQPAAFCGLVGLKPTYGRVSRFGLIALASSTDVIGTLTKTSEDAAFVLEVIAGFDQFDATSAKREVESYSEDLENFSPPLKIGFPKEYFGPELSREMKDKFKELRKDLEGDNFEIKEISLPHTEYALAAYYIINSSEASSNLARYDGIRYGFRSQSISDLMETYFQSRGKALGMEPKRRIMLGTYSLSHGYYDDYYLKAQKVRKLVYEDFINAFKEVDIILTPTAPTTAFKLGEKEDPLSMYLSDVFLTGVSLAGLPALSLPYYAGEKLPYSIQLIAPHFSEKDLLKLGHYLEKNILAKE